jgi:hypothetical protein
MHINKVHRITTITRVARAAWRRRRLAAGGCYGVGEDGVMAFTDFGIETLMGLITMYNEDPTLLRR